MAGGAGGVTDAAGNPLATSLTWTFTTANTNGCPCSIWTTTTTPGPQDSEVAALELGMKFQRTSRERHRRTVYKYPANTGTHVGSLWTATGTLLGSVTFTGETASGWQQATFGTPIAIAANRPM